MLARINKVGGVNYKLDTLHINHPNSYYWELTVDWGKYCVMGG